VSIPLSRRTLLRGLGGLSIALPWLEAMTPRTARAATAPPLRFLAMFTANGTVPDRFFPTATGSSFTLPSILQPLAPFQSKLLVLDGIDNEVAYHGPGERHMMGMGSLLTGHQLQAGTLFTDGSGTPAGWGGGISVDQAIAQSVGGSTPFKSLEFGVIPEKDPPTATVWDRMVYAAPGVPVPPMADPVAAFNRLFSVPVGMGTTADAGTVADPKALARKTILDLAKDDITALQKRLGTTDRQKLDAHLTAIRDLESRLTLFQPAPPMTSGCSTPAAPAAVAYRDNDNYPKISSAMLDLIAAAFACNLTRVATLQYSYSRSYVYPRWLGISQGHHGLSHDADSVTASMDKLATLNAWYAAELASFLQRLSKIPEGSGTVLDNTLVLWGNELGHGSDHTDRRVPFVLAGGAGGAFRMGRSLKYGGAPAKAFHNNLLVSCMNAMGVSATTFGDAAYCTGALPDLV